MLTRNMTRLMLRAIPKIKAAKLNLSQFFRDMTGDMEILAAPDEDDANQGCFSGIRSSMADRPRREKTLFLSLRLGGDSGSL